MIAPTQVSLWMERNGQADRPALVMAALTADTLWIQKTWELRQVPLLNRGIEARRKGKELILTLPAEPSPEVMHLAFATTYKAEQWSTQLHDLQQQPGAGLPPHEGRLPDGVTLVRQGLDLPHVVLCEVVFSGRTRRAADQGLQLRGGICGADAVVEVKRDKTRDMGSGSYHARGLAVRIDDANARRRLRVLCYDEGVSTLVKRALVLLALQAVLLFLGGVVCAGASRFHVPTGETLSEEMLSTGMSLALIYSWPLLMLALLRVLRWPQLVRITGLAVLAVTTGRVVAVWLGHLLAVHTTANAPGSRSLWVLLDPVDWAFIIAGVVLSVRAWRLSSDAREVLPREVQTPSTARKVWAGGLVAVTALYALFLLGFAGMARYEMSAHLLQPGVDPRREQQALLVLNQGAAQANRGDLIAAEQSFQRSLRLWEQLTAARSAPLVYQRNLAVTLYNLGWVSEQQGRVDEAEKYYARAVQLADDLGGAAEADAEYRKTIAGAREALAALRGETSLKELDEKNQAAAQKYEEAAVQAEKGGAEAEGLFRDAIALWEEVLPHATSEQYRKAAPVRLAAAYLRLAEVQQQLRKRSPAEASLKKAIEYGEQAIALEPDRPLSRHNLEVARQQLEGLRAQALREEFEGLCAARRFADALDLCMRGIQEQEKQVHSGKDREAAVRQLAYRLERYAWFLAHCPDDRLRDAKAAVRQARRAVELQPEVADYWYTLAMVQYRNGDWRESLGSLEKVKARDGAFDASAWLLVAMNRHQLRQKADARAAHRKAVEWIEEMQRKAEDNAVLRIQYEMMRPTIEALRREAENLLDGKGPGGEGIG
jgi:tetratricopeptide (TPR) repeat protein